MSSACTPNVLVVTKGHPFERMPFFEMLDALPDIVWTHVEQPAACALLDPIAAEPFDAILFYDLPGAQFTDNGRGFNLEYSDPPERLKSSFEALLEAGKPLVFLHHALSGWPTWPRYAEILGARYNLKPIGDTPDDGFRFDTMHRIEPVIDHPITQGLEGGFDIEDEIYLYEVDERGKVPLLRSTYGFDAAKFHSTAAIIESGKLVGTAEGWRHPEGSDLVAWLKAEKNSPVVYIQCGHGPAAYANASYRRLLRNTIGWICGGQATAWAQEGREKVLSV